MELKVKGLKSYLIKQKCGNYFFSFMHLPVSYSQISLYPKLPTCSKSIYYWTHSNHLQMSYNPNSWGRSESYESYPFPGKHN